MPLCDETDYVPTEKYARAKELLAHAEMIGRRYDLYQRTLFQTEVQALRWDETSARWSKAPKRTCFRPQFCIHDLCFAFLVSATRQLTQHRSGGD